LKIAYVFTSGRRKRFNDILAGKESPSEFLLGIPHLLNCAYKIDIFELPDLISAKSSVNFLLFPKNAVISKITGMISCSHFLSKQAVSLLNNYDIVIACNEYVGFGLSYYKKKKVLKTPLIVFIMGMLAKLYKLSHYKFRYSIGKHYYKQFINCCRKCIFLGLGEYNFAANIYPYFKKRFKHLPFPVDTEFWKPCQQTEQQGYILFIGNDKNRDFDLAVSIACEMKEHHFKFITKQISRNKVTKNVQVIAGDWKQSVLSDTKIREIVQNSMCVILPLKETLQPSGQSVCQLAMSCGKPVIITRTKGFWAPEDFTNKKHLYFIESNRTEDWCKTIIDLKSNPDNSRKVGANARKLMEDKFNIPNFSENLIGILKENGRP
jgi:glycosyltransferase involved in cell wall biosynthesis